MRLFLLAAVVLPFYLLTGAESNVPAVKSVDPPLGYAGTPAPSRPPEPIPPKPTFSTSTRP